jgi:hypothetical protein
MKVQCLSNDSSRLSSRHYAAGYTTDTTFDLKVDDEYTVFAVSFWKGVIVYLLDAHSPCRPHWYPAVLFRVVDDRISPSWGFAFFGDERTDVEAILGYEELVRDASHFDLLAEGNDEATIVFLRRKAESEPPPGTPG